MKMKILTTILIFAVSSVLLLSSQAVVLIKGKVLEEVTNRPIGTSFVFRDAAGKTITIRSNSIDGEYQQVIKSGTKYSVAFEGYRLNSFEHTFVVPTSNEYMEIERNFNLSKIELNDELFARSIFNENDSTLSESGIEFLGELKSFLVLQKLVNVDVTLNVKDCSFKSIRIKVPQEGKKKYKTITLKPDAQATLVANGRVEALRQKFKELGIRSSGVNFIADDTYTATKKKKNKGKSKSIINEDNSIIITVSGFKKF